MHTTSAEKIYERLMSRASQADPFDRHVLACIIAAAPKPLAVSLGLDRDRLGRLLETMFPGAYSLADLAPEDAPCGEDAIEEPDFRRLLQDGRAKGDEIEDWLAHIVARRSMLPEHLWISLGLRNRKELSDLLHRHFPKLAARNVHNMRWKKFFYREMCQSEGVYVCKSPVCDDCANFDDCFGTDDK